MRRSIHLLVSSWRSLRVAKLYSATVVAILATVLALLSVTGMLNALFLTSELPYDNAGELWELKAWSRTSDQSREGNTGALVAVWLQDLRGAGLVCADIQSLARVRTDTFDERLNVDYVTPSYFEVFGARTSIGQSFRGTGNEDATERSVVISHDLASRLVPAGQDPTALSISIDGQEHRVIGVMQEGFLSPRDIRGEQVDVWLPWASSGIDLSSWQEFNSNTKTYARVRGPEEANRFEFSLSALTAAAVRDGGKGQLAEGVQVTSSLVPLRESVVGDSYKVGIIFFVATILLGGLGVSFVATMYVARATRRRAVYALHGLIGARSLDLFALASFDLVVLLIVAGLVSVPLAMYFTYAIKALGMGSLPRLAELDLNISLVIWIVASAILVALIIGGAAMVKMRRTRLLDELSATGKGTVGRGQLRFRRAILSFQFVLVALSVFLGSVVLSQSLQRLAISVGYEETGASYLQIELPEALRSDAEKDQLSTELERALVGGAHLDSIAAADMPPLSNALALYEVKSEGGSDLKSVQMQINGVGERFLSGLKMHLIEGRLLQQSDFTVNDHVVVLGKSAAREFAPVTSALGQRVNIDGASYEVVGIVNDVVNPVLKDQAARLQGYIPYKNYSGPPTLNFVLFHPGQASPGKSGIARAITAVHGDLFIDDYRPLHELRSDLVAEYYIKAELAVVLVGVVLLMATAGVYALITYLFYSTRSGIATRLALGASRANLIRELMKAVYAPIAISTATFVFLLAASSGALSGLLDVRQEAILGYGAASLSLTMIALVLAARSCSKKLIRVDYRGLLQILN